tara:strand:- start:9 stop:572 length:564 start_codon:yes stop_codon:yes gene_type:complete
MHNCVPSILILLALSQIIVGCSNNSIDENMQFVSANKIDRNEHSKDAEKIKIKKNNTKSSQRKNFGVRAFLEDSLYDLISAELAGMRGKGDISQKNYSQQARKTLDPKVIERAAKISFYYDNSILFLEMTTLWIEVEPHWVPAKILHAIALIKNHRHEAAMSVWNEALKEYPNNSIIMKTMEQFKVE